MGGVSYCCVCDISADVQRLIPRLCPATAAPRPPSRVAPSPPDIFRIAAADIAAPATPGAAPAVGNLFVPAAAAAGGASGVYAMVLSASSAVWDEVAAGLLFYISCVCVYIYIYVCIYIYVFSYREHRGTE
jgi:hypothetical protein